MPVNIEIKARTHRASFIREWLLAHGARFAGVDSQTDTYFTVPSGRLKLREGSIENNLIAYDRPDTAGPRKSNFLLYPVADAAALKAVLCQSLGIKVIVVKRREIYFLENVKFHIDEVEGLGHFMEIEASDLYAPLPEAELRRQCDYYIDTFGIQPNDMLEGSYSDLLLALAKDHSA